MDDFKAITNMNVNFSLMDCPCHYLYDNPKKVKRLLRKKARRVLKLRLKLESQ